MKAFMSSGAGAFGRTLGDVTKNVADVVGDTFNAVRTKSGQVAGKVAELASDTYDSVKGTAERPRRG